MASKAQLAATEEVLHNIDHLTRWAIEQVVFLDYQLSEWKSFLEGRIARTINEFKLLDEPRIKSAVENTYEELMKAKRFELAKIFASTFNL